MTILLNFISMGTQVTRIVIGTLLLSADEAGSGRSSRRAFLAVSVLATFLSFLITLNAVRRAVVARVRAVLRGASAVRQSAAGLVAGRRTSEAAAAAPHVSNWLRQAQVGRVQPEAGGKADGRESAGLLVASGPGEADGGSLLAHGAAEGSGDAAARRVSRRTTVGATAHDRDAAVPPVATAGDAGYLSQLPALDHRNVPQLPRMGGGGGGGALPPLAGRPGGSAGQPLA